MMATCQFITHFFVDRTYYAFWLLLRSLFKIERTKLWIGFLVNGPPDLKSLAGMSSRSTALFTFWHFADSIASNVGNSMFLLHAEHNFCEFWWLSCRKVGCSMMKLPRISWSIYFYFFSLSPIPGSWYTSPMGLFYTDTFVFE